MTTWTRKVTTRRSVVDDEPDAPTRASQLTSAAIQRALLDALALGPKSKYQLRDSLQINEHAITRELLTLRDDGTVKAIGNMTKRKYALKAYQPPFMTHATVSPGPKAEVATSSWWVTDSREAFTAAAAARARERSWRG